MNYGYLINAKQIIAYAKWYLQSPLQQYFIYHKNSDFIPNDYFDRKEIEQVITKAKKHPHMLRFGKEFVRTMHHINQDFGYNGETSKQGRTDVPEYIKYLKRQTLLNPQQVLDQIDKINRHIKRINAQIKQFNQTCDNHIVQAVIRYPKAIQYRKFLGNHNINYGKIRLEVKKSALLPNPKVIEFERVCVMDGLDKSDFDNAERASHHFKVSSRHQVFYRGNRLDIYGTIAFWANLKTNSKDLIPKDSIPDEPAFLSDLTYSNINKTLIDIRHPDLDEFPQTSFSDLHLIYDYRHYAKPLMEEKDSKEK